MPQGQIHAAGMDAQQPEKLFYHVFPLGVVVFIQQHKLILREFLTRKISGQAFPRLIFRRRMKGKLFQILHLHAQIPCGIFVAHKKMLTVKHSEFYFILFQGHVEIHKQGRSYFHHDQRSVVAPGPQRFFAGGAVRQEQARRFGQIIQAAKAGQIFDLIPCRLHVPHGHHAFRIHLFHFRCWA
nr:MAG TPA: hypothetical protein [Caudoviricetes sp.]